MEIVSCDGGQYSEPGGDSSWADHVLQDDASVYCTKGDRCNIILRHQRGTPFSLRKLVVKAPKNGFDSPIQEGMIFVSSDDNDLLSRTAQYQIQYSPRRTRPRRSEYGQITLTSSHEYFHPIRSPLRSIDRSTYLRNPFPPHRQSDNPAMTHTTAEPGNMSQSRGNLPELIPGFHVNTRYDDIDSDSDDAATRRALSDQAEAEIERALHMRDHRWPGYQVPHVPRFDREDDERDTSNSSEEEEDESPDDFLARSGADLLNLSQQERRFLASEYTTQVMQYRRSRQWQRLQRGQPSRIEVVNPGVLDGSSEPQDVLAPHARFFIRRHRSCVTLRFDPPVAGKFILIKLWAPSQDSNIDIQSIVAHGFAGPRFFPSLEFR